MRYFSLLFLGFLSTTFISSAQAMRKEDDLPLDTLPLSKRPKVIEGEEDKPSEVSSNLTAIDLKDKKGFDECLGGIFEKMNTVSASPEPEITFVHLSLKLKHALEESTFSRFYPSSPHGKAAFAKFFESNRDLFMAVAKKIGGASSLVHFGKILFNRGLTEKSYLWTEALLQPEGDLQHVNEFIEAIGESLEKTNKDEARKWFLLGVKHDANCLNKLGAMAKEEGKWEEALMHYREVLLREDEEEAYKEAQEGVLAGIGKLIELAETAVDKKDMEEVNRLFGIRDKWRELKKDLESKRGEVEESGEELEESGEEFEESGEEFEESGEE